ncbi:hypothetical protein [Maritalea mediterranea]|uniref:Uncharacterized protein n=1 Tax=Maritalea mediterranea TaxID=2909667 RepID=A0ABS9E4Q8_9HYPH|nr:hypothetical protein [Maritalea mediterranea]MCF4097855.1 hypothetical protein [Maritalea mediterranea]
MQLRKIVLAMVMALLPISASAAQYEVQAQNGNEQGWSLKADCEANLSTSCTSAYFCSNEIWMANASFDAVQQRRYDGQQLVIVKDGNPICAVN